MKKIEDLQRQEALAQQAELERQIRLDRLREKVCISVAADPMRVLRDTEAYRSRLQTLTGQEREKELQEPLFVQHGYTQEQVCLCQHAVCVCSTSNVAPIIGSVIS